MCFSLEVSAILSGVLFVLGSISVFQLKHIPKACRYFLFSILPLLFAMQQASEAVVWYYLNQGEDQTIAVLVFLFFAYTIWPVYVPITVWCLDIKAKIRKGIYFILALIGLAVSLFMTASMVAFTPSSDKEDRHVNYDIEYFFYCPWYFDFLYIVPTVVPFFVAYSVPYMLPFGVLLAGSCVAAYILYNSTVISVWCFFAAGLSAFVVFIMWKRSRSGRNVRQESGFPSILMTV